MKSGFVLGLLCVVGLWAQAQQPTVTGAVLDSASKKPLAGATISVIDARGEQVTAATTNAKGEFSIKLKNSSSLKAAFSYVQYASRIVSLSNYAGEEWNLGQILLSFENDALQQVVIQGRKPPVAMRFDRQVYQASNYANATGGTGVDILRNLPSVSVDASGNIQLRGSSSFLLLINGKAVQGDPAVMLAQLPSANIENIEIISNPSATYDADGRSGIVNVIMKNYKQDGWVLQANVMGGVPPLNDFDNDYQPKRYSGDVGASYRKGKLELAANVNYLRNDQAGQRDGDVYTIINNHRTQFPSFGERSFNRYNYGVRLSAAYEINDKHSLSAGFYSGKRFQIRDANLNYQNNRTDLLTGNSQAVDYYNANRQQKEGQFTLANLEWLMRFSKQSSLTITALYERAALQGLTTNLNVPVKGSVDTLQYTRNPSSNPLDAYRIKADYKNGAWAAGYQFRYDTQDGNFLYLTQVPGTNSFVVDPAFTSRVKASNYIHAGYLQYDNKWEQLQYSMGLRVETTDRTLRFSKDNETRTLSLVNLFPTAQLRYKLPDKWALKAGLSRRIRRTNNYELNPFPEREHSETLEQGDPDLLPEFITTTEIGVEHSYPKGSFFVAPYFQHIANPIQRTNAVYNDTILNRVFTNGKAAQQWGVEIGQTQKVTPWWQSVVGFNFYYYRINGSLFNNTIQATNSAWAYSINITESFNLGKNWSSQLGINYLSKRPTLQGEDSYFLNPSVSVRKQTADKRWSFQLLCQYVDLGWNRSNQQRITTRGSNFYSTTNYIYEVNQIQFSVSFNLLKQNRKIVVPVSEIGEKEF